jgi:hypothetical protein
MPTEDLSAFLRRQSASALADILIELAHDHLDLHKRLQRLQLSDSASKLAAAFKKALADCNRSQKYHDYKSVGAFAAISRREKPITCQWQRVDRHPGRGVARGEFGRQGIFLKEALEPMWA